MSATTQEMSIQYIGWINVALRQMADEKQEDLRETERTHRIKTCLFGCVSGVLLAVSQFWF